MQGRGEESDAQHSWEIGLDRTWDVVQEDEHGNLLTSVRDRDRDRARRNKAHRVTQSVRRGLIRYVFVALDQSASMKQTDMRPSRATVAKHALKTFVHEFFDQNPISQLGLMISCDRNAEKITDLSGNPKSHERAIDNLSELRGPASLQRIIDLACVYLKHIPDYGQRELIIVYGSISTSDTGDIFESIKEAKQHKIRISVVCLTAEVHVLRYMAEETHGTVSVALDVPHFRDLLAAHTNPPPYLRAQGPQYTEFVQMGFPRRKLDMTPSLCYDGNQIVLQSTAYVCPRCATRATQLPTQCTVCGLQLNSSAHIARSHHHLFPVPNFVEVDELRAKNYTRCCACMRPLQEDGSLRLQCPKCAYVYCVDCDMFIHDQLHNCLGCM